MGMYHHRKKAAGCPQPSFDTSWENDDTARAFPLLHQPTRFPLVRKLSSDSKTEGDLRRFRRLVR